MLSVPHMCQGKGVTVDKLLPDVLHFPPATDLHDHPLVQSSCLILQVSSTLQFTAMPLHLYRFKAIFPGTSAFNTKQGAHRHVHQMQAAVWVLHCIQAAMHAQSKSSCMPAHALNPGPEWEVVDACAAPGNKTTQVAGVP